MNNIELARSNIKQAEERLKHAREALESGNYPYVIRQCQEAVELALKARALLTFILLNLLIISSKQSTCLFGLKKLKATS